jgi:hypothetical protein
LNLHFVQEFCFRSHPYNCCPNCKRWGVICGLIEPANTITKEEVRFCKFKSGSVFLHLICVYDRPVYAHWIQEKMWILKDLYLCPQALTEESNSQRPIYMWVRSNGSGEVAKTSCLCLPDPTEEENSLSFDCQTKNLKDFRNIEFFFVEFGEEECRGNCRIFYLKL